MEIQTSIRAVFFARSAADDSYHLRYGAQQPMMYSKTKIIVDRPVFVSTLCITCDEHLRRELTHSELWLITVQHVPANENHLTSASLRVLL